MGEPAVPLEKPSPPEAPPTPTTVPETEEDWGTRYKYLLAEFDNYRKRVLREQETAQSRVRGSLLRDLLPIYEAFERGRETVSRSEARDPAVLQGLELVETAWRRFLIDQGVEAVARIGQPFAHDEAEAVGERPATPDLPAGVVAEIVQQGYRFRGGLLRPAKVVVTRAPGPPAVEDGTAAGAEPTSTGEEH